MLNSHPHSAAEAFAAQAELVTALQERSTLYSHSKGTVLFRQGEPARGVFVVLEGSVRLSLLRDDSRSIHVRTVGPGYLLGLPGVILRTAYLFTAKVSRDARVAFVEAEELLDFLRQRSDLCFDVVELLGGELLEMPPAVHLRPTRHHQPRHHA